MVVIILIRVFCFIAMVEVVKSIKEKGEEQNSYSFRIKGYFPSHARDYFKLLNNEIERNKLIMFPNLPCICSYDDCPKKSRK